MFALKRINPMARPIVATITGFAAVGRLAGERWFCSEADARTAGWRKARS
jgi:hypothetical protein